MIIVKSSLCFVMAFVTLFDFVDFSSIFLGQTSVVATPFKQSILIRVPQDVASLQQAIAQVSNGGIIELAGGTYVAPAPEGFEIKNIGKSFAIRAATGATVILDGGGANAIVSYLNTNVSLGGPITFDGLTFANGRATQVGRAAGVTIAKAEAIFTNCSFNNNINSLDTTGGGILITENSKASFTNCVWTGNQAKVFGAGLAVSTNSSAYILDSSFLNNRTNLPGHYPTSAGGGIHVVNSFLSVRNSSFEGNQAGYAGGAIYALGTWVDPVSIPNTYVSIFDSTFTNNLAVRDPSVNFAAPTEGGAIHAEDQTKVVIYDSTFSRNQANTGGGVNTYRGIVEISGTIFTENQAVQSGAFNGFGGAICATSSDASDGSTLNGTVNRRSASLTVKDTLIQGSSIQKVAQAGGGICVAGDANRVYGQGVPRMGTLAENRVKVNLNNVIFDNTDVEERSGVGGTGIGGGLWSDVADLTIQDVLVIQSDALGSNSGNSSGGGMAILDQTTANLSKVTIARSTAGRFGAGFFVQGSSIQTNNCRLIENEISPGFTESVNESYGSAIFSSPDISRNLTAQGKVENCVISSNTGLPIFDDDRTNGPINDVRYNQNQIFSSTFGTDVYRDSIAGIYSVSGLNNLTVTRANGTSTDKSQGDNIALGTKPSIGVLQAVPSSFTVIGSASSQANGTYTYYLGYAWSGNSATLDGTPLSDKAGVIQVSDGGSVHTLVVDGVPYTAQIEVIVLDKEVYLPVILH